LAIAKTNDTTVVVDIDPRLNGDDGLGGAILWAEAENLAGAHGIQSSVGQQGL